MQLCRVFVPYIGVYSEGTFLVLNFIAWWRVYVLCWHGADHAIKLVWTFDKIYASAVWLHGPSARTPNRNPTARPVARHYEHMFPACMVRRIYVNTFEFLFYGLQIRTQTQIFFYPFYSVSVLSIVCCLHAI